MRIPYTIPRDTFEVYRCSEETQLLGNEAKRTLRAEDEKWYEKTLPPDLKTQSLHVIAKNWREHPILDELPSLEDRDYLLEILPLDLPFEFVITKIPYDHYWERASKARWEFNDLTSHGNSWLRLYCEKHLAEYLEKAEPAFFEPEQEKREALIALVTKHIYTLRISQLLPLKSSGFTEEMTSEDEDGGDDYEPKLPPLKNAPVNHIPLGDVFNLLPNLTEIYINIALIYRTEDVDMNAFEMSVEDCLSIKNGVRNLQYLRKFSLTRSKLDQPKAAALLQGLAVNLRLVELDLSHCELGDEGAHAIGAYLAYSQVKILHIANNKIGERGMAGIALGLLKDEDREPSLKKLNLKLNPLGDEGAMYVATILLRNSTLEYLNVSGCSITADGGMRLAEVLTSGSTKIQKLEIDCSNNDFGPVVGEAFEVVVKSCVAVTGVDMRMCGFNKESEFAVFEGAARNLKEWKGRKMERRRSLDSRTTTIRMLPRVNSLVPPSEFELLQRPNPPPESSMTLLPESSESTFSFEKDEEDIYGGEEGKTEITRTSLSLGKI